MALWKFPAHAGTQVAYLLHRTWIASCVAERFATEQCGWAFVERVGDRCTLLTNATGTTVDRDGVEHSGIVLRVFQENDDFIDGFDGHVPPVLDPNARVGPGRGLFTFINAPIGQTFSPPRDYRMHTVKRTKPTA